jgi:hypothetical protein
MANVAVQGVLYGTGANEIILVTGMFINTTTWTIPDAIRLPAAGGTYTNCSKGGNQTLNLVNPASDSTFTFTVEWTMDSTNWYTTDITGILLHSLGLVNISTTQIKNAIGEDTNVVSELCSSPLVNKYAEFCPDGNSPYKMGDFRKYAHSTPGGTFTRTDWAGNTVPWKTLYIINGFGGRVFKEITNRPYSATKLQIRNGNTVMAESDEIDIRAAVFGIWQVYNSTNIYDTATNETWHIVTQHLYGGTWYDEADTSFTVSFAGDPFTFVRTGLVHVVDTLDVIYTSTVAARGLDERLTVGGANGGYALLTNSASPEQIEYVGAGALVNGSAWKIEIYYNAAWIQVLAGTIP